MEIHVVTAANSHLYTKELDGFFRARHRIYVEEKKWREPRSDGRELDAFDNEHATYLIGMEDDEIVAGSRLVPTTEPHLLSEVFPHLCDFEGVVRDPFVAEWTRGFIVPERREIAGIKLKGQFCSTVMEYCLQEGIKRIGGIQEMYWLPLWKRFGWNVRPVGNPALVDDTWCVPAFFDVTEEAREGAARFSRLSHSILKQRGPHRAFVPTVAETHYV